MQQVDHRPQMAAFFDVHLEDVAQVVERRTRHAEHALLLDRRRLGVALGHNQPPEQRPEFAGHVRPRRLTEIRAEIHFPVGRRRDQKDAPAILGHLHVIELRPPFRLHADRGAQVDVVVVALGRPHVVPPAHVRRLPVLERTLKDAITAEINVVRDAIDVIDVRHSHQSSVISRQS